MKRVWVVEEWEGEDGSYLREFQSERTALAAAAKGRKNPRRFVTRIVVWSCARVREHAVPVPPATRGFGGTRSPAAPAK